MQQRHKRLKPKRAATSWKQESIQQDRQADFWTGVHEACNQVFHRVTRNDCILWRGRPPSETKEETTSSLKARCIGASTTLGTFACTDHKETLYQG
jgi:hypothetical protein